jgi:NAD(P)-dependent dehydrogenase (short-subunit alcohol dehydrogenase family)
MSAFPPEHVALVTGASLGIGAASAVELAKQGAKVAVHYRSSEAEAKAVVEQILALGREAEMFQADVSIAAEARALGPAVLARFGRIDTLVNNAGSLVGRKSFEEIDDEFWQQVIDVNMSSILWVSQPIVTHMKARGSGPGAMPYAMAKAAVTGITKGMAKELIAHGIRVNAINPGVILTPFQERFSTQEGLNKMIAMIPQGRGGVATEISPMVAFLASEGASHMVGESVEINGGMLMD